MSTTSAIYQKPFIVGSINSLPPTNSKFQSAICYAVAKFYGIWPPCWEAGTGGDANVNVQLSADTSTSIRRSPRHQPQANYQLAANGILLPTEPLSPAHSEAFYDDHDNLLTPCSESPPLNKAAIAAAKVKKLRHLITTQESLQTKRASPSASLRQPFNENKCQ